MEFKYAIQQFSSKVIEKMDLCDSEEATKHFLQAA